LVAHIAGLHAFAPGFRIERTGVVEHCHEHVSIPWTAHAAAGEVMAQGHDFGDVATDGRLRRVIGFREMS
jgi:hypothetical protein